MNIRFAAAVVIAATALTACGSPDKPAADTSAAPTTSSASAASSATSSPATSSPAAAPAKGDKPPREFVVGKWGTDGDCALAIDLRADGTSDGPFGNWTYNDGVIGFVEDPDFTVAVTVVDDDTMSSKNDSSGKTVMMTRCP